MQQKLLLNDRQTQILLQRRTLYRGGLHERSKETNCIAPRILGPVHGKIGLLEQIHDQSLRSREQSRADTRRIVKLDILQLILLVERVEYGIAHHLGLSFRVNPVLAEAR